MAKKKIVFVIVEGPSDEFALGVLLTKIYDKDTVEVFTVHGDITTDFGVTPANIVAKIGDFVRTFARNNHYKPSDFKEIIHIVDTDGAYIPDTAVVEDIRVERPYYSTTDIRTPKALSIIKRNKVKRENMDRLKATGIIWKVPYRVYYMSCNLDHVLHGKLNSSDEEKELDAYSFVKRYRDNVKGFLEYILLSDFAVGPDYKESWKYISEGLHSLERHTNLGICFSDINKQNNESNTES